MPVVFRHRGDRFHFYANEGDPREPLPIHVLKDGVDATFWLSPNVCVAYNDGFSARVLRELSEIVRNRRAEIEGAWHEFFGETE